MNLTLTGSLEWLTSAAETSVVPLVSECGRIRKEFHVFTWRAHTNSPNKMLCPILGIFTLHHQRTHAQCDSMHTAPEMNVRSRCDGCHDQRLYWGSQPGQEGFNLIRSSI